MYYKELLRVRSGVMVYALVIAIAAIVIMVINAGAGMSPDAATKAHTAAIPVVAIFAIAGVLAAILATVFGASLNCDGDGHMELVGTRPISRTGYALQVMLIDVAGIVLAFLLTAGAAAIVALFLAKRAVVWQFDSDFLANALRFSLFPLAWYAILQALTAGYRGRSGLAQGLIWPIAFGMGVLSLVPLPAVWHSIFAALNVVNPFAYATYQMNAQGVASEVGIKVLVDALALAVLTVIGVLAATLQWKRVEA
ncbi:MAG TPA: hypothetical protein VN934_05125 [Candidatus Tumulicola sp.]|nr:hypothetical protein [Candidatus Tumulicola sp.]